MHAQRSNRRTHVTHTRGWFCGYGYPGSKGNRPNASSGDTPPHIERTYSHAAPTQGQCRALWPAAATARGDIRQLLRVGEETARTQQRARSSSSTQHRRARSTQHTAARTQHRRRLRARSSSSAQHRRARMARTQQQARSNAHSTHTQQQHARSTGAHADAGARA